VNYQCVTFVCVLVQSGIDVNRLNSYEQTALEVVNKFTASRGAREIKQMLRGNVIVVVSDSRNCDRRPDTQSSTLNEFYMVALWAVLREKI